MKKDFLIDKNDISLFKKVLLLILHIRNWYMVIPDKFGLISSVKYRSRGGLTFICRPKSTDINEVVAIISGAEYPEKYIRLNKNDHVFDLGANMGSFALYLDHVNRGIKYHGYAFEPLDQNYQLLQENCKLNRVKNFQLYKEAVSGKNGTVYMDTECLPDRVSILESKKGKVPTKSIKLSTFCNKNRIKNVALIKMDIEGSEYDVISEDLKFIKSKVKKLILEYHDLDSAHNKKWIFKFLSPYFKLTSIYEANGYGVVYAENRINFKL